MTSLDAGTPTSEADRSYTIREGRPTDVPTIVEFNLRLAAESEGKTLDRAVLTAGVGRLFEDRRRGRYIVAERDGQVVGQLMLTYEWTDWRNGSLWWIQSVYVAAAHRRRGLLRKLLGFVEASAEGDPDFRGLRLYVERENEAAQQAYFRLGFIDSRYFVLEKPPGPASSDA